jgi:hypothetical protein
MATYRITQVLGIVLLYATIATCNTTTPIVVETSTNDTLANVLIIGGFTIAVLLLISFYYWIEKDTSTGHHAMRPVGDGMFYDVNI